MKIQLNKRKLLMMSDSPDHEGESGVAISDQIKVKKPRMYAVLMHNDDYSTMEFVLEVLQRFFDKSPNEAHSIMMEVHTKGHGVCGVYTFEVAESKAQKVMRYARSKGHPLKCSIRPE